jgi:hypothetical protein
MSCFEGKGGDPGMSKGGAENFLRIGGLRHFCLHISNLNRYSKPKYNIQQSHMLSPRHRSEFLFADIYGSEGNGSAFFTALDAHLRHKQRFLQERVKDMG